MGDFEVVEETSVGKKSKSKLNFKFISIIVIAIFIGISIYFVSSMIFGKNGNNRFSRGIKLSLEDELVQELYSYVTYGINGERSIKYIKEKSVKLENFTNYEKFYYALMFATKEDFKDTGEEIFNRKTYVISNDLVKKYMKQYFGDEVSYNLDSSLSMSFDFEMDGFNTGVLNYDKDSGGYTITFVSKSSKDSNKVIEPYYVILDNASRESDGTIILKEKIIYISYINNKDAAGKFLDSYDISIYKDYNKTMLIERKSGYTKEMLNAKPLSPTDYKNNSNTITYKFKKNRNGEYYFYSSEISN